MRDKADRAVTHNEESDFAAFLQAVREYASDGGEQNITAHTSSVTSSDWERIQALVAARREDERKSLS